MCVSHDQIGEPFLSIIPSAKSALLSRTNILSCPDEMDCLDSFLLRAWQMGWLEKYNKKQVWIDVNVQLPTFSDWCLGIFKENKTGWINPIPFVCTYIGKKTPLTTSDCWILRDLTDAEKRHPYYEEFDLVCVAWTFLPEPYSPQPK